MKGSLLSVNPEAIIIDITHDIRPQDIQQAAFLLDCSYKYFPKGSIHVAAVDPGVGTERRALALATADGVFVGPDNGILSAALPDSLRQEAYAASIVPLPEPFRAHSLTEQRFHRQPVSPTFHARDIFAPVAAHISLGVALSELGPAVREMTALPPFRAEMAADGSLIGRVIHVDRFGNVITTIRSEQMPASSSKIKIAGRIIVARTTTYAEATLLTALVGSCGYLEIALNGGSAAKELGVTLGDPVLVRPA